MWSRKSPDTGEADCVNNSSLAAAIINHHLSSANQCQTPCPWHPDPFVPSRIAFSRFLRPLGQSPEPQVRRRCGHWGCPSKQPSPLFTHIWSVYSPLTESHEIKWTLLLWLQCRWGHISWHEPCGVIFFSFSSFYMSPERTNGTLVLQISTFCISFSLACCTDGNGKRYRLLYFNLSQTTGRMWTLPSTATLSVSFSHRMKPWQMNRWKKCLFSQVPGLYCLTDGVEERKKMWRDDWFLIYD